MSRSRPIRWSRVLLIVLCAALSFGGTFTCSSGGDSIKTTEDPPRPAK
jgi:hypothetical protein